MFHMCMLSVVLHSYMAEYGAGCDLGAQSPQQVYTHS